MNPAQSAPLHDGPEMAALLGLAQRAARAGGAVARRMFENVLSVELKPDGSEVSNADHAAQAEIVACIRAERPGDRIIAEETLPPGASVPRPPVSGGPVSDRSSPQSAEAPDGQRQVPNNSQSGVCWAIDPIDGTRNYIRGIPLFGCSVAAMIDGWPVAGAVFDPLRDLMYAGDTARVTANGRAVRVVDGDERLMLVAIPSKRRRRGDTLVQSWVDRYVVRNVGSSALHLAMVAAGQLDACLANDAKIWDIAAGWLMVRTGGGVVTTPTGGPLFPISADFEPLTEMPCLAAGPRTHARLVAG